MNPWSEEEIFFDDEDMSTEEMMWHVILWYGEALNPVGFFMDPAAKFTPRGFVQTATVGGALYSAAWILGGPLSDVAGQAPTFSRMAAMKAEGIGRKAKIVARSTPSLLRGIGYAIAYTVMYYALQAGISEVHDYLGGPILPEYHVDVYQGGQP